MLKELDNGYEAEVWEYGVCYKLMIDNAKSIPIDISNVKSLTAVLDYVMNQKKG